MTETLAVTIELVIEAMEEVVSKTWTLLSDAPPGTVALFLAGGKVSENPTSPSENSSTVPVTNKSSELDIPFRFLIICGTAVIVIGGAVKISVFVEVVTSGELQD